MCAIRIIRVIQSAMMVAGIGLGSVSQAVVITYAGEDLGLGPPNQVPRLSAFPNASAAQAAFLSQLNNVRVEDFEGIAQGNIAPVAIDLVIPPKTHRTQK